jgi:hypothetical protein
MKGGSKSFTFAFIIFLFLVIIIFCCFSNNSNIIEGLDVPCSKLTLANCDWSRCTNERNQCVTIQCGHYPADSRYCPSDKCKLGYKMNILKCLTKK